MMLNNGHWKPDPLNAREQFLAVRAGDITNPSPPEIGLRMAKVWDAIQASARQKGRPVAIQEAGVPRPVST